MNTTPYRTLNSFLRERFGQRVQKITLDAGLSCPNRDDKKRLGCIYCNERGSGTGALDSGIKIKDQIEIQMALMSRRYKAKAFIAYFQSYSNTYAPLEHLKSIYDHILPYTQIIGLTIGTRPDCIDEDKLTLIDSYSSDRLVWVEYGLQSANDETLKRINRGHDVQTFIDAVRLTSTYNMRICAHVIIGLPGEGIDDYISTAILLSRLPITDVKIHLLYIIKGTPMEELYKRGDYKPLSRDKYAESAAVFIAYLRDDIVIQRITGDPHRDELIAPLWPLEKAGARAAVHDTMARMGLYQGLYCCNT